MDRPILVLGAAGQLGQEVVHHARDRGADVVGATRAHVDIRDPKTISAVLAQCRPRLIVNCAAYTAVDKAESETGLATALNTTGARHVAEAAAARDIPLIHMSTDYVFDGTKAGAYTENDPIAPLSVYGRTKAHGEDAVRRAAAHHIILRTSWLFGRFGSNFLKTMLMLAQERPSVHVVSDQRGCPTATIDVARAILSIDTRLDAFAANAGTYHVAGGSATTWHGFAEAVVAAQSRMTGKHPKVEAISASDYPAAAARPANSELDSTRFKRTFGHRGEDWKRRVEETVTRLLEQNE